MQERSSAMSASESSPGSPDALYSSGTPDDGLSTPNAGSEPAASPPGTLDDELHRVESLLAERAHENGALQRELGRQRALLREALERVTVTTSAELAALRRARDAAIQRAIEAELGRASLAFELDETRACLQAQPAADAVSEVRTLYARIAQLEETDESQRARLLLAEHELAAARETHERFERLRSEDHEAFELELLRARGEPSASAIASESPVGVEHAAHAALVGEINGLRARLNETERAFRQVRQRCGVLERTSAEAVQKLADVQAQSAELAVLAQSRASQISELGQEVSRQQQQVRSLQTQLGAQQAEREQREAEVQAFMVRVAAAAATSPGDVPPGQPAASAAQHSGPANNELRVFLASLRAPLAELEGALIQPSAESRQTGLADSAEVRNDSGPGSASDLLARAELEQQLSGALARMSQLEAALAAAQTQAREPGVTTLKGELIDTRADAARLSDDLQKERVRRRKLVFTVRALQAATESGEAPGPWIEELIMLLNEGASMPPFSSQPPP